jgi:predicted metalloprotease with PDZ domain
MPSISHRIDLAETALHLISVEVTLEGDGPLPSPLTAFMPVWTPGSYLLREFARHVEALEAFADTDGARLVVRKVRKNAWRIEHAAARRVRVRYRVWANDLSVRTNHADGTHALVNGAATFLAFEGFEAARCSLEVARPERWRVATALARDGDRFVADDYDALVDAPLAAGIHDEERFELQGKGHTVTFWPEAAVPAPDRARFARDLKTILETESAFFGGALPYETYVMLLQLWPRGRGGLEHASSAALLASPSAFGSRDGYLDLLSLAAHEAFHLWNVKRIRPAAFVPPRYETESYTRTLWWFEGGTSYYDWLTLRRAGLATVQEYLDHLGAEMAYVDATPGRLLQALEDASFDAWIKLYRPDENTANSTVSYYRKGEVVCALLDLEIRARSKDARSLDDVLRALWDARDTPIAEDALSTLFERAAGVQLQDLFDAWIRRPGEIDYDATLSHVGLRVERFTRHDAPASLGLRARADGLRTVVIGIPRGGAAHRAGIDVGDELLAIGGRRVDSAGAVDGALAGRAPGGTVEVLVSRDGRTTTRQVTLDPPRPDRVRLVNVPEASAEARARLDAWLGPKERKPTARKAGRGADAPGKSYKVVR